MARTRNQGIPKQELDALSGRQISTWGGDSIEGGGGDLPVPHCSAAPWQQQSKLSGLFPDHVLTAVWLHTGFREMVSPAFLSSELSPG